MAHFAKLNFQMIVSRVIVADQEFIDAREDADMWVQTSYNTRGGVHYTELEDGSRVPSEDQSKALRKNFAGIGCKYNPELDAFVEPKMYNSWILNEDTCLWDPPYPCPELDANQVLENCYYMWSEDQHDETGEGWVLIEPNSGD